MNALPESRPQRASLAVAGIAAASLLIGAMVYLLDRPPGSASFLPRELTLFAGGKAHFGKLGDRLPSFAHALAFSLISCVMLPRRTRWCAASCVGWALVDCTFEIMQMPYLAQAFAVTAQEFAARSIFTRQLAHYFSAGTYDGGDVVASVAGAAVAFVLARLVLLRRST